MSQTAARAIASAIQNKAIAELLAEDREIFGVYGEVYDFIFNYYSSNGTTPSARVISSHFKEEDLIPTDVEGDVKYYLSELREEYVKGELDQMIIKIDKFMQSKSSVDILEALSRKTAELSKYVHRAKDVDITDVDLAVERFRAAKEASRSGTVGIPTGIEAWDACVPMGMAPGHNIVLMGYSGKGKSFIADLIIANAYLQGKKILLFSLEMSADEQRQRIYSIIGKGRFFTNDLALGNIEEATLRSWSEDALNTGGKIIVTANDGYSDVTPNIMRSKIEKYRPDLVVLDYLQLAMDNGGTKDMTPRMLNLSREIKQLATAAQIPIITITAVTDDDGKKRNSPPTIAQIAWSKAIEYDADLAVAIHKYDGTNIIELACRKNRRGEMFNMRFEVDLGRGIFTPMMEVPPDED